MADFDEISLLKVYMKAYAVYHNLIQSISNPMVYEKRGTEWNRNRTEIFFGNPSDTPA